MLELALIASFATLLLALLLASVRLHRGPGTVDRIIIFDLFTSIAVGLMAIAFLWLKESTMLDIALLLSIVSFISTIGFARYLEQKANVK